MKAFVMAIALLATVSVFAQVTYTDSADLSSSTHSFSIVGAQYTVIPTHTKTEVVPGCTVHPENYPETCTRVVVLAGLPVITVNVSYRDSSFVSEGNELSYASFTFKATDFEASDVAALKGANSFSRTARNFASKYFTLSVTKASRKISVVDARNSTICNENDLGQIDHGCVENLVYKVATTFVNEVNVIQK